MRKPAILFGVLAAAGAAFWQASPQARPLPEMLPGGALLCLESRDLSRIVREWDRSAVKRQWLRSANYEVFSRSNLLSKLQDLYGQYAAAATFEPDLTGVIEIAGSESALALYDIREVEFLYVTKLGETQLAASRMWRVRGKFEQRQAAGMPFYLRRDAASGPTIAFAFAQGYLFLGSREDLVARGLELLGGSKEPSVAGDRWFREPAQGRGASGELRLELNLDSLIRSTYFRSYWIHRNASVLRQYWAGVSDLERTPAQTTEKRLLLRAAPASMTATPAEREALSRLVAMVPADAGLYRGWAAPAPADLAELVEEKLLGPTGGPSIAGRFAPQGTVFDRTVGSEADLETRIDEPPLPAGSGGSLVAEPLRALIAMAKPEAALHIESSVRVGDFVLTPSALVIETVTPWVASAVRDALSPAAGAMGTTSGLGSQWKTATAGRHTVEQFNGLAKVSFAVQGRLLFLANDTGMLAAVMDRVNQVPTPSQATYVAGFRHGRERGNYERLTLALDFAQRGGSSGPTGMSTSGDRAPALFSENLIGLSRALAFVDDIEVTTIDHENAVEQALVYHTR
jgi:hypothetical protein